jgi:hypothetical protein
MPEEVRPQYENAMTKPLESLQQQIIHKALNFELFHRLHIKQQSRQRYAASGFAFVPHTRAVFLRGRRWVRTGAAGRPLSCGTLSPTRKHIPTSAALKASKPIGSRTQISQIVTVFSDL